MFIIPFKLEIRKLVKKDHKRAIQFAIEGMHFDWYVENKFLLNLYGRYFWYTELNNATQIIAAYNDNRLAGVLLCEMKGEPKASYSLWRAVYVGFFNLMKRIFLKSGSGVYSKTNEEMFQAYSRENSPDGEIRFLAADLKSGVKGVGTVLLEELARRERSKKVYLYTDDGCTYEFYDHRGFDRAEERTVDLVYGSKKVRLRCFLYSKVL